MLMNPVRANVAKSWYEDLKSGIYFIPEMKIEPVFETDEVLEERWKNRTHPLILEPGGILKRKRSNSENSNKDVINTDCCYLPFRKTYYDGCHHIPDIARMYPETEVNVKLGHLDYSDDDENDVPELMLCE